LDQGLTVAEVSKWGELGWQWRLNWRRGRFERESVLGEDFLRYVAKGTMNKEANDRILWGGDSSGASLVKSAYAYTTNQVSGVI